LPRYLAGPVRAPGQLAGHFGEALLSGRAVILLVIAGAILVCLLAVPVLTDIFLGFASVQGAKIAKATFLTGLGILLFGLVIGVEIVDIIGGGLMGAVILGIILDNY
jgi:hypothetical protein